MFFKGYFATNDIIYQAVCVLHKIFNQPDLRLAISFPRASIVSEPEIIHQNAKNLRISFADIYTIYQVICVLHKIFSPPDRRLAIFFLWASMASEPGKVSVPGYNHLINLKTSEVL